MIPNAETTVSEIVSAVPSTARTFEALNIDYCCGGKLTLAKACEKRGISTDNAIEKLVRAGKMDTGACTDAAAMGLAELADHIEAVHHAFLREHLPWLGELAMKVSRVHGDRDDRLHVVRQTLLALSGELSSHMMKEERILFPMVRQLADSSTVPDFHCGSLAGPVGQMELEHDQAGGGLNTLEAATDGFRPPDWACNSYRALLDGLARLQEDLHQHIHKENNILFPRALGREAELLAGV